VLSLLLATAVRPRSKESPLVVVVETKERVHGTLFVTARQGGVEACGKY
jgi:hypothetical protein